MSVKPVPDGYHSITPYLILRDAAKAIEFYKAAFGATEIMRLDAPGGLIGHAEIRIGDSPIMLADECPEAGAQSPETLGGSGMTLMLYLEDVDSSFKQAIAAGGTEVRPVQDQFYGDRAGTLKDPYGHTWTLGTHKEDLSMEQINERMEEWMKKQSA